MLNKDIKEQIPLFEIPESKKDQSADPNQKPVSRTEKMTPNKVAKQSAASRKSKKGSVIPSKQRIPKNAVAKARVMESQSGQVPEGDVRLTANIRDDLHLKLKITAARRRTTIGELIEELVENFL
jgi:hypothetical protein